MKNRERKLARCALPLMATVWAAQVALLILLQTSMIPQLGIPAEHFIAREALQCCFMLAMCTVFLITSYTLVVTCRAARAEHGGCACRKAGDAHPSCATAALAA